MMDVQLPQIASAGTSGATGSQCASRPSQGGCRRESSGSGKTFSSELHDARTAKISRHEPEPRQTDREETDTSMSTDDADSSSATTTSACAPEDRRSCRQSDETAGQAPDQETATVASDVTTQSLLLALVTQPTAKTDAQPLTQVSTTEPIKTDTESVMPPVTEDGTSLPVTAADSSNSQQTVSTTAPTKPTDFSAVVPSDVVLPDTVDPKVQPIALSDDKQMLNSQAQPVPDALPQSGQEKQADSPKPAAQSNDSTQINAKTEPVIQPASQPPQTTELLDTGKAIAAQQIQRSDDKQPVAAEHPVQAREIPQPKEEPAPKPMAAISTGSQELTNQDRNNDRESSGQDHRDRSTPEQLPMHAARTESAAQAVPSNSSLLVNGMDQRVFSSAPSAKLPAEAQPAVTTPPVQPTDWMPGTSANQTKSMVLELSQADLGRVNIRVAVNQDVVHTHFSSDRSDMGQYLQSGQERLQSALQTSGLDLGRFQVDIDRQSAGRSFQQPASQGQSNGRSPHEDSHNQGQGREEFTREPASRRGKLNLVA